MPVENLQAANVSGVPLDQWAFFSSSKVNDIQEGSGTGSFIYEDTVGQRQCYNVAWPSADVIGAVNSLKVRAENSVTSGSGTIGLGVRNGAGETESSHAVGPTPGWDETGALAKPGGGGWVPSDCADGVTYLQFRRVASTAQMRVYEGWVILDYENPGEAFITFLSWLGPLLGAALTYGQFCRALELVARVHPTIRAFSEADKREMWQAFCGWRRPAMV